MKHILIPVDFSDNSWASLVYAVKLFNDDLCTFYLLHTEILDPESMSTLNEVYLENVLKLGNDQLQLFKTQIKTSDHNANHEFKTIIKFQPLTSAVKETTKEFPIDLIIMCTKGINSTLNSFFGTNSVNVVKKHLSCPVMIIPEDYDYKPIKQIAFSTGLNRFYTTEELTILNDFSYDNNATLRIMHIKTENTLSDIQQYNLSVLKTSLQGFQTHYHSVPNFNKKAEVINTFISDLEIDLLVMVNYKHSILEKLLNEPVIKKIGFNPLIPFLVIPNKKTS